MEISNISVMPLLHGKFDCIAICQFTIDDSFIITGLKLYEKNGKRYIVFPKNEHNRKQMKYCHPINDEVYQHVLFLINKAYNDIMNITDKDIELQNLAKEEDFYKQNFGTGVVDELATEFERNNTAKLEKLAHAMDPDYTVTGNKNENTKKKSFSMSDVRKWSDEYNETHNIQKISVDDLVPNGYQFDESVDAEEAMAIEQKAMNIDLMHLLANNTPLDEAKKYLKDKYRNCAKMIDEAMTIMGCPEEAPAHEF